MYRKHVVAMIVLMFICSVTFAPRTVNATETSGLSNALEVRYLGISGDATLLQIKKGSIHKSILVDTGQDGAEFLKKMKAGAIYDSLPGPVNGSSHYKKKRKVIDYVFITHLHPDHMNGVLSLLKDKSASGGFVIRNLYVNTIYGSQENNSGNLDKIGKASASDRVVNTHFIPSDPTFKTTPAPVKINPDPSFNITLLLPIKQYSSTNDCSMMVKIHDSSLKTNFVFGGDIMHGAMKEIMSKYGDILSGKEGETTYFKLPHHSSRRVTAGNSVNNLLYKPPGSNTYDVFGRSSQINGVKKAANYFKNQDPASSTYSFTYHGTTTNDIINYDGLFNTFMKGKGQSLIGIGNVKYRDDSNHDVSDTLTVFPWIGLNAYHDVGPTVAPGAALDNAASMRRADLNANTIKELGVPEVLRHSGVTYKKTFRYN